MAWTTPITWTAAVLTTAQMNAQLRDNMLETAVAKATAASQYFVSTGANVLGARQADSDVLDSIATTASTTYVHSGMPTVTCTTGAWAFVCMYCYINNNTNSQTSYYTSNITGTTTSSANDNRAIASARFTSDFAVSAGAVVLFQCTSGSGNTFTTGVRATGGTGTWDHRRLAVLPM